jgi:double-stranded uracil-DNA glycosylase
VTQSRPTKEDLEAARGRRVRDVISSGLDVLFCGINPGLYSGAVGHHFARPGNRFWPALYHGGFTDRLLTPYEEHELLDVGVGITNLVNRTTARADELSNDELRRGAANLRRKVRLNRPGWLAMLGLSAWRVAFGKPRSTIGPQTESIGETRVWLLPNPSGLNAHYQPPDPCPALFGTPRGIITDESGTKPVKRPRQLESSHARPPGASIEEEACISRTSRTLLEWPIRSRCCGSRSSSE